ncbi:hypothetical protein DFH06DRAFT_1245629 [Mycena polygramma]|nr:hypothetical protein DFH06DRAFT_1245629 [Mycena polygramma]
MYVNSPLDVYVNGQQCFLVEARRKLTGLLSRPAGYPLHGIAGHPVPVCSSSWTQEVPNTGLHGRRHHPPRDSPQRPFSAMPFSRSSAMTLHSLSITTHRVEPTAVTNSIGTRHKLASDAACWYSCKPTRLRQSPRSPDGRRPPIPVPPGTAIAALPTRTVPCRPSTCLSGGNCYITAVAQPPPQPRRAHAEDVNPAPRSGCAVATSRRTTTGRYITAVARNRTRRRTTPARRMATLRRGRDALWTSGTAALPPLDGAPPSSPTAGFGVQYIVLNARRPGSDDTSRNTLKL